MVRNADIINITLQMFSVMVIGLGVGGVLWVNSFSIKKDKFFVIMIPVILKLFFVNYLGAVIKYYYEKNSFYMILLSSVSAVTSLAMALYITYKCRESLSKAAFVFLLSDVISLVFIGIFSFICSLLKGKTFLFTLSEKPDIYNLLFVVIGIILIIFFQYGKGNMIIVWMREHKIKHKWLWPFLFILEQAVALIAMAKSSFESGSALFPVYVIMVLTIFAGACVYSIYQYTSKKRLYLENKNLLLQQNLITEYYAALKEQINMTKKFRHDMVNHMETLDTLAKKYADRMEIRQYADSLKKQYEQLDEISYCKNTVINSILYNKVKICKENNIITEIDMNYFDFGEVAEIEILSILYNLFDNAIEACKKEEKNRFISLSGISRASYTVLKMRNSMSFTEKKDGKLVTTKQDKDSHGIGLMIVEDIVNKYQGYIEIQTTADVFEIIVGLGTLK